MWTVFANKFICKYTLEQIVHNFFLNCSFNEAFNSIHKHVKEFVYILLYIRINWASINIFKSLAKFLWIEILLLNFHQASKDAFNLIENIFIIWSIMIAIFNFKDTFSKCWNHIELL